MRFLTRFVGAAFAGALALTPAPAQTWSGGGGSGSWSNDANWTGGSRPASSATTAITFAGTNQLTTTQDIPNPPLLLNSLTFDATAGAFTVGGTNELRFSGASPTLVQSSANPISITTPVSFDASGSIGGTGTGSLSLGNLTVRQGTVTLNRNVTVGSLTLGIDGATSAPTVSTGSNVLTLAGNVVFVQLTGTTTTPGAVLNGTINLGGANRTFHGIYSLNAFDITINATLTGTGGFVHGGDPIEDRSWVIFNAQNTYTGPTILEIGSERLFMGLANAVPSTSPVVVRNGSQFYLTNSDTAAGTVGFSQVIGSLSDAGSDPVGSAVPGRVRIGQASASTTTLTVGGDNTSTSYGWQIDGGGQLIKVGTGTLTLSNNDAARFNSYTGGTTINGGTLLAVGQTGTNSATGTGAVTVNAGGTLGGNGQVTGAVTLAGRFQGGNGVTATGNPTLTTGAVTFSTGSQLRVAVGGATPATVVNSKVATAAAFNAATAGSSVLEIHLFNDGTLNLNGTTAYSITVATFGSTNTTAGTNYTVLADNFSFSGTPTVNLTGGTALTVSFTPVPEPVAVFGLVAVGLGARRLARKRGR
jgi:fibronectin-binding autotransporter adhesin